MSVAYDLHVIDGWVVRDGNPDSFETEATQDLAAHVRSGDYFSTLASNLDALTDKLSAGSSDIILLEHYVRDLMYLDKHYKIVPRKRNQSVKRHNSQEL